MKVSWTKGLTKEKREEVEEAFSRGALLRRRLKELLEDKIEDERKKVRSEILYDNPNWAYRQADAVGYERALNDIISLIYEKEV